MALINNLQHNNIPSNPCFYSCDILFIFKEEKNVGEKEKAWGINTQCPSHRRKEDTQGWGTLVWWSEEKGLKSRVKRKRQQNPWCRRGGNIGNGNGKDTAASRKKELDKKSYPSTMGLSYFMRCFNKRHHYSFSFSSSPILA